MKWTIILSSILVSSVSLQCGKDDKEEPKPPTRKIDTSRFTATDISGYILVRDESDWTLDSLWTAEETALFTAPRTEQLANTEKANITFWPAFPNPMKDAFYLEFNTSKATFMQYVITDSLLNVKTRHYIHTMAGVNRVSINPDMAFFADQHNYRFYYCFYSEANGRFAKGHGDLRIIK